jgi:MarR family transcriptional regulator, organic hydroperoxide resistance regulator
MTPIPIKEFARQLDQMGPELMKGFSGKKANEIYKGNITLPQFLVLSYLFKKGTSNMTDLAHYMSVTTAAMTGIVDRMVKPGYCKRIAEPHDRRIILIELTAKGKHFVKTISKQRQQVIIEIFGKISEEERNDYLRILGHIHEIVKRQRSHIDTN